MRALIEQWETMEAPAYLGREAEMRTLIDTLRRPGGIAEVVASPGMGKTAFLKALTTAHPDIFDGTIEYFAGSSHFPLSEAIDVIAERLRAASGHSLLVIDDAESLEAGPTYEAINRLSTGPWRFSTVLGTRRALGLGDIVPLDAMPRLTFAELMQAAGGEIPPGDLDRLWQATQGNPLLGRMLVDRWRAGLVSDPGELPALLLPLQARGLLGPDGEPLRRGSGQEQRIITDIRFVSDDLLRALANDATAVLQISPRKFEEVVAELLQRRGYDVTLTQATRDGGKDMYAARRDDIGSFLYIVECKQHAPDRPVGVGVVRAVHGVAQHERVNGAVVMTTSYFSAPAKEFAEELKYQVTLKDYFDLHDWLREFRR